MRFATFCLTGVMAIVVSACAFKVHVPYTADPNAGGAPQRAFASDPTFDYLHQAVAVNNHVLDDQETETYRVRRLSFPSVGENGQKGNLFTADYYQSKLPGPKKLVIVLPIWGSYTYPSDVTTAGLLDHTQGQANVLNVLGETYIFDWEGLNKAPGKTGFLDLWKQMAPRARTQIIDLRRLIDWAEAQPETDPARIGVIGFSYSAIFAALLTQNEPRLAATVLIMGAVHPNVIIATCVAPGPGLLQDRVKTRFGWSTEEYAEALEPIFRPYDPAQYPGRVDPSRVLIIDSYYDKCVPEDTREALWQVMGKPERISVFESHKGAFLAMTPLGGNWMRHRIYAFFDRSLNKPPAGITHAER